jgi:hypothetical protein
VHNHVPLPFVFSELRRKLLGMVCHLITALVSGGVLQGPMVEAMITASVFSWALRPTLSPGLHIKLSKSGTLSASESGDDRRRVMQPLSRSRLHNHASTVGAVEKPVHSFNGSTRTITLYFSRRAARDFIFWTKPLVTIADTKKTPRPQGKPQRGGHFAKPGGEVRREQKG